MAIKNLKATSAGARGRSVADYSSLTASKPEKSLLKPHSVKAGRNNTGRITVRHRGGNKRKHYRSIDFRRAKDGVEAVVKSVEYDPFRSCFISLVQYRDGEKSYILCPVNLEVGHVVSSGAGAEVKVGNALPLKNLPTGTQIHNVEVTPGRGGQLVRAAGEAAVLMAKA